MYLYPQKYHYTNDPYDSTRYKTSWHYNINDIYPSYKCNLRMSDFTSIGITKSAYELSNKIRELWEQHTVWTRSTIYSLVFELPDLAFVTDRLLQNPDDFGNLFSEYYGDRIGIQLRDLLRDHLVIAADLVKASKAGDTKAAAEIERKWYANGDEITAFLSSINPYWSEDEWKSMFRTHLGLVKAEAVNLLTKNYEDESSVYDELERQALDMADLMLHGIVMQFPQRFR
jgi:hypothetical protein